MTLTDLELVDKHKISKETKRIHKKRKVDRTAGAGGLTNDDYNLIADRMEEVSNETCKRIDERNADLVGGIMELLQTLCVVVKEVRVVLEWELFQTKTQEKAGPS